jgi:hypothetical protein
MRWKPHVRFGGRAGKTDRRKRRHGVPVRSHLVPTGDDDRQWPALAVDRVVDLRGQPAPRPANAVTCRFNIWQRRILVVR